MSEGPAGFRYEISDLFHSSASWCLCTTTLVRWSHPRLKTADRTFHVQFGDEKSHCPHHPSSLFCTKVPYFVVRTIGKEKNDRIMEWVGGKE